MRPRKLKLSAFGSYAGEVEIDFTQVQQGVFLITGDTGSGKTTIFDGITYALYGQTSGGRREGSMMRSQYALAGTKTFVELEFESRNMIYRVMRNPEYERESKRKNKEGQYTMTKEKAGVELYLPDGSLYRGNRQETNKKLVEILGMDGRQFTQISMIAQGDFLKLLLAKSDERKEIFSRIFDTGIFWKVQEELKNRTRNLYGNLEDNRKACLREMEELEGSTTEEQGEYREFLKQNQKEPDLKRVLEWGKIFQEKNQKEYEEKTEEGKRCAKNLEDQNRLFSLEKHKNDRFCELDQIYVICEKLEKEKKEWEEKEKAIERAEKCLLLLPQEEACLQGQKNLRDTRKRVEGLEQWFQAHGRDIREKQEKLDAVKEYEKRLEEKEIPVLNRLSQALEQYQGLEAHLSSAEHWEKKLNFQKIVYKETEEKYHVLCSEYEQKYQAYFQEQAGILAAELSEGKPCPVCGSLSHPQKAELSLGAPTRESVEATKKARDKKEEEREKNRSLLLEMKTTLEREMAAIRQMEKQFLGQEEENQSLEQIRRKWSQWKEKAEERLRQGQKKVEEARKKLTELTEDYQKAVQEESVQKGKLEENRKLEKSQEEILEKAVEKFNIHMRKQGFSDMEEYRKCRMSRQEMENARKAVDRYRRKQIESEQKRKILEDQLKGQERPDLEKISEKLQNLKEQQHRLEVEIRKLYSRRERNRLAFGKLVLLAKERERLRREYEILSNLSKTANGSLNGSVKIDFESYMQRQYFEQMIRCANHHLQKMASGQFLLQCRKLENLSTQGNAGLDLDVYSMVTGKIRDVKTLSGGESFMAALALALGMTDVITRAMGAVRADILFIDEGFGSLDDNAREQAIRILQGLAGGNRMVGIISHVTELKEQIEKKLTVTKDKRGSRVQWK